KKNMVTPEALDQMIGVVEDATLLKNKLKDFSVVYKAYENEKAKDYFDDEDFYMTLLESLPKSQNLKHATIWIDGFDSFTVQELQILSTLSTLAAALNITICTDGMMKEGHFDHTNGLFKRFSEMARENDIALITELCERSFPSEDILHVAENLLAYPYVKKAINQDVVQIFVADNRLDEVEYCAAKIVDLVGREGFDWQDFAVVTNDLEAYAMSIKRIFDEFELPYFLDQKRQVANNPLVHLIKSYLHMYSEGFSTEQMVNFLKTGLVESDALAISRFEIYAKQYGVREKKLLKPFEIEGQDLTLENGVRETLASLIVPEFKSKITVRTAIEKLFELLIKLEVNEKIDTQVKAFTAAGNYDEAQQFAQIWNKTMDLFDQLVEIMGDEVLTIEALVEVVESGFETTEVGLLPLSDSQILIGTIDRSRAHPIKVLFFLGLNDGIVPELGNDKQLILDSEKAFFSEKGIKLLADSQMFLSKEQFNLYFAMTRPTERLYFSYARSDSEGRALRPSYFINKLSRICSNIKTIDARITHDVLPYRVSTSKGTVKHLATEMRRAVDGYPVSPEWEAAFAWYAENERQT
ncbi:MAG TPA: 3'-5' exonuclease, partial [Fusibacter sp.]|nr:3'-5' exonuclease [Fusibacter sp.]